MKKLTSLILILLINITTYATQKYYGKESTEAILDFDGRIELDSSLDVNSTIDEQLQHLIGHFHSESFKRGFGYTGVLGDQYDYKIVSQKNIESGRVQINYHFSGKVNFESKSFGRKSKISVPIRLPFALDKVYQLGIVRGKNKCTDSHYNSEGDFFYFWDPDQRGCPLKNDKVNVVRVNATLKKLPNTKRTYPEYHKLYQKKNLDISVFVGYIDKPTAFDDGTIMFNELSEYLEEEGFSISVSKEAFSVNRRKGQSHYRVFEKKKRNYLGFEQNIRVKLLLADTDISAKDRTFQTYYLDSLLNDDIIAYDGHSGLGANIGADYLEDFKLSGSYQILFLNGCSSYPYFNSSYFERKRGGTKNLEIITSGQSTLTSTSFSNMIAFLDTFLKGKTNSYQTILDKIELSNGDIETYLMGVNGDEDNTFQK